MEDSTILLSDPNSKFNIFKRILSIAISIPLVIMDISYFKQNGILAIFGSYKNIELLSITAILLLYGLKRSEIYERCYFTFKGDKITGVYKIKEASRRQIGEILLNPSFQKVDVDSSQIKGIEIKVIDIIINLKDESSYDIDLENYGYEEIKKLKECFRLYNKNYQLSCK